MMRSLSREISKLTRTARSDRQVLRRAIGASNLHLPHGQPIQLQQCSGQAVTAERMEQGSFYCNAQVKRQFCEIVGGVIVPPRADAVLSATADTPSATATSRRSPGKGEWPGSATAAIIKEPVSRASSRAGSRSSGTGCASTATGPGPPPSRSSTECSTLDARTPSASPDQQWGMGAPLPLPPPCNTLAGTAEQVEFGESR